MFPHAFDLLLLLLVGLLVFGPKRMIDLGSAAGKAFREFREATKEISWPGQSGPGSSGPSAFERVINSVVEAGTAHSQPQTTPPPPPAETVVESTVVSPDEHPAS